MNYRDTARSLLRMAMFRGTPQFKEAAARLLQLAACLGDNWGQFFDLQASALQQKYRNLPMDETRKLGALISALREDLHQNGLMASEEYQKDLPQYQLVSLSAEERDQLMSGSS